MGKPQCCSRVSPQRCAGDGEIRYRFCLPVKAKPWEKERASECKCKGRRNATCRLSDSVHSHCREDGMINKAMYGRRDCKL